MDFKIGFGFGVNYLYNIWEIVFTHLIQLL